MSLVDYVETKEYIVTVYNRDELPSIYEDLESKGKSPVNTDILRAVECTDRRPASRNTVYRLTNWEAHELKHDPRVRSIELIPSELGIQAGESTITQTSTAWDKSSASDSLMKNWGLLRCVEGVQRTGWGGLGYDGNGTGTPTQTGTINLTQTGKNVDVVIVDGDGLVFNHPEYAVNADGTGGSRAIRYNWAQHNPQVTGGAAGTYVYGTSDHATHVAGTVAGNTQGWARKANIYNIFYFAGAVGNLTFPFVMDYVREFHRTKSINPATGRKNPTITNNSWGMSIFPNEWSLTDITAVTYRGTRYTPSLGAPVYTGYSGVCTANTRLAELAGFENHGNRITTTGPYTPPGGSILTKPAAWPQQGQQASLNIFEEPLGSYEITVQGPARIELLNNLAVNSISGVMNVTSGIAVNQGATVIETFSATDQTTQGGSIETDIRQTVDLLNNAVYTITFTTDLDVADAPSPVIAVAMSLTVVTESTPAAASVSTITNTLQGPGALDFSFSPTVGLNDDGYWTLNLPFAIEYLGTSYSTIYVSTNHYLTFTNGSTNYLNLGPANPNLPKIMWSCADNSVQRIYYGVENEGGPLTYTVSNSGASAYTINAASNPTLNLKRGSTYTFTVNASGHPFWIKTAAITGTGSAYSTGVTNNGAQVGTVTFTVPLDAPSTLYYICQLHSSMQGIINITNAGRTYRVRVEGTASTSGIPNSPNMVNEYVFYEAIPNQIDLQLGVNARKTVSGGLTIQQLNAWGLIGGNRIPVRVAALDSDIEDAIDEGILFVGAAGNGEWKHDVPGGLDWDNTFEMANRYPGSVTQPYYYMRGTSPTANDTTVNGGYDLPNICVGAIDAIDIDQKVTFSDCGPGVDIWAPGTYIISALPFSQFGLPTDPRNSGFSIGKFSGTSMASPQVCGVLASALETYPSMNQEQAKAYITGYAKVNQVIELTTDGPTDYQDLQGAPNLFLFYKREREIEGNVFPKINNKKRPITGQVWPRVSIRKT